MKKYDNDPNPRGAWVNTLGEAIGIGICLMGVALAIALMVFAVNEVIA